MNNNSVINVSTTPTGANAIMSNNNSERYEFESLASLLRDNEVQWAIGHDGESSHKDARSEFTGRVSYEGALALTAKGWRDGARRVEALRAELNGAVQAIVAAKSADMVYAVEGDWVDTGRVVTGEPECCGSWVVQGDDRNDKIIKIIANISVSAAVNSETIFARGAACLAAVDILETLGRRVELWIGLGINDRGKIAETHVLVKPASQPVEIDRLAYVLCHPAMLRRIMFAHMESRKHNPNRTYPAPVTDPNAIVLSELKTGRRASREENVREVVSVCEKAGIVFDDSDIQEIIKGAL